MKAIPFEEGSRAKNRKKKSISVPDTRALKEARRAIDKISTKLRFIARDGKVSHEEVWELTNATRKQLSELCISPEKRKFPHNKRSPRRKR